MITASHKLYSDYDHLLAKETVHFLYIFLYVQKDVLVKQHQQIYIPKE